jgi:hypothetical protein
MFVRISDPEVSSFSAKSASKFRRARGKFSEVTPEIGVSVYSQLSVLAMMASFLPL